MTDSGFDRLLAASTAVDLAVAGFVLWRASRPRSSDPVTPRIVPSAVARALAVTTIVFLAKLPLLVKLGLNVFGLMHLLFLDAAILLPPAGLAMLYAVSRANGWTRRRAVALPFQLLALAALAAAPLAAYARWVEPFRLRLETADIPVSRHRAGSRPLRIGILADIQTDHVTDYEVSAIDRLMALEPDVILLPGDLFHGRFEAFEAEVPKLRALLSRLSAPGGVFFVLGDVENERRARMATQGTPVRVLINEITQTIVVDRRLTIAGIELDYESPAARRTIRQMQTRDGRDDIRLLLTHRPDPVLQLGPGSRIDLVVAGHTHGGQVVLPLIGPLITLSNVPRAVAAGGYHVVNGQPIYISRGVGHERGQAPRIRFLCPPEISLITLGTTTHPSADD